MADLAVLKATGSGVTANSTVWQDVATIPAASFTTGKTYLILALAFCRNASSANEVRTRLSRGLSPVIFDDSSNAEEILANTSVIPVGYMVRFTQPATTEKITLQISSSSTTVATCDFCIILAIPVSDIGTEDTDWRWAEILTDLTLSTSYQDGASETFTANGSDRYMYLAQASWTPGSATAQTDIALVVDGAVKVYNSEEGEDTATENRNRLLVWEEVPTAASHTVKLQAKGETAAGTVRSSRVFVLNLSKLAQNTGTNGAGPTNLVEGSGWINLATTSISPAATGDFVVIAGAEINYNAALTNDPRVRLQVNPDGAGLVSKPAYGDHSPGTDTWDGTDHRYSPVFDVVTLTAGAARPFNLDGEMAATGVADPIAVSRALVVFSVALPASGESHSGTATMTGGGALVPVGQKAASSSPILTGGGVVVPVAQKDASVAPVMTGGGIGTLVTSSDRSGTSVGTGGGVLLVDAAKATDGTATMTGGGIVAPAGQKDAAADVILTGGGVLILTATGESTESHSGTAVLTGGGTLATAGEKGGEAALALTGGGALASVSMTDRTATAPLTGGGVLLVDGASARENAVGLTGGGVAATVAETARAGTPAMTGGGILTIVGETARSSTVTATGGGVLTVTGDTTEQHGGSATMTGGGALLVAGESTREGAPVLSGGGIGLLFGEKAAEVAIIATGGGVLLVGADSARENSASLTGHGTLVLSTSSARAGSVTMTGGGTVSTIGGQPPPESILEPPGLGAEDDAGFMLEHGTTDIGEPGRLLEV